MQKEKKVVVVVVADGTHEEVDDDRSTGAAPAGPVSGPVSVVDPLAPVDHDLPPDVQLVPQHRPDLVLDAVLGLEEPVGVALDPVEHEVVLPRSIDLVEAVLKQKIFRHLYGSSDPSIFS